MDVKLLEEEDQIPVLLFDEQGEVVAAQPQTRRLRRWQRRLPKLNAALHAPEVSRWRFTPEVRRSILRETLAD